MVHINLLESVKGQNINNILTHHKISLKNSLLHRLKNHAILFSPVCLVIFFAHVKTTLTDFLPSFINRCLTNASWYTIILFLVFFYMTVHTSIYLNILILALPTFFLLCYPFKTQYSLHRILLHSFSYWPPLNLNIFGLIECNFGW